MSNAATHAVWASAILGAGQIAHDLHLKGEVTPMPLLTASAAALMGSLPDLFEPATNPHHRQFFHSIFMLGCVGYAGYRAYQWEPKTDFQTVMRWLAIVASGAYVVHLLCDARTPRSLPLLGKI